MQVPARWVVIIVIPVILMILYLSMTAVGAIPPVFRLGYSNTGEYLLTLRGLLGVSLLLFLLLVSNRRVLGTLGRCNRQNGAAVKAVLAIAVIAMSFGLLYSLGM